MFGSGRYRWHFIGPSFYFICTIWGLHFSRPKWFLISDGSNFNFCRFHLLSHRKYVFLIGVHVRIFQWRRRVVNFCTASILTHSFFILFSRILKCAPTRIVNVWSNSHFGFSSSCSTMWFVRFQVLVSRRFLIFRILYRFESSLFLIFLKKYFEGKDRMHGDSWL